MEAELINTQEGLEGELGYKGERGYSAYEIAVKNGYEGTEQDWIDHFGLDLTDYIKDTDIVDNCESTTTTKPLSANQGKRLMDWVTSLYRNKPDRDEVVIKDDIAVLTGTITNDDPYGNHEVSLDLNYPEGFDRDNSVVVGGFLGAWCIPGWSFNASGESFHVFIACDIDKIHLFYYDYSATAQEPITMDYKIFLMRIDEEE